MKLNITCESCERTIKIEYDESVCTPEYCPFCGEELGIDSGDYVLDIDQDEREDWG